MRGDRGCPPDDPQRLELMGLLDQAKEIGRQIERNHQRKKLGLAPESVKGSLGRLMKRRDAFLLRWGKVQDHE